MCQIGKKGAGWVNNTKTSEGRREEAAIENKSGACQQEAASCNQENTLLYHFVRISIFPEMAARPDRPFRYWSDTERACQGLDIDKDHEFSQKSTMLWNYTLFNVVQLLVLVSIAPLIVGCLRSRAPKARLYKFISSSPTENYGFNWAIGKVCSFSSFDIPQVKGKSNQLRRSMRGKASVNTGAENMIEQKRDYKSEGGSKLWLKGSFWKYLWKSMSFF